MKKNITKVLGLVLVLALFIGLAGCSSMAIASMYNPNPPISHEYVMYVYDMPNSEEMADYVSWADTPWYDKKPGAEPMKKVTVQLWQCGENVRLEAPEMELKIENMKLVASRSLIVNFSDAYHWSYLKIHLSNVTGMHFKGFIVFKEKNIYYPVLLILKCHDK